VKERIILGIDPGTSVMGYGVIHARGSKVRMLAMGLVKMNKISDPYLKLKEIFRRTTELIDKFSPDELAIESPFFGKNVQSMLKLGRAQGVAISAALQFDIPIFEYAPRKIKLAITGQGSASKEQVAGILLNILGVKEEPEDFDATDALAAALCHFYQKEMPGGKSYSGWGDFLKKNPQRKA
jgi:crossover junction endodeoxyribonuclease RuvC